MECIVLVVLALLCPTLGGKLPSNFQKCPMNDQLTECLKAVIPKVLAELANGSSKLGTPPLEPLVVPSISVQGTEGAVSLSEQSYKDLQIHHLTKMELKNVEASAHPDKFALDLDFLGKQIVTIGQYTLKGRILLLPIGGHGLANSTYGDVKIHVHMLAKPVQKNGKSHYSIEELTMTFDPGMAHSFYGNLIEGNEQLTAETNKVFNENWKEIVKEARPVYEEALAGVFKAYIQTIFSRVEIDDLFAK